MICLPLEDSILLQNLMENKKRISEIPVFIYADWLDTNSSSQKPFSGHLQKVIWKFITLFFPGSEARVS